MWKVLDISNMFILNITKSRLIIFLPQSTPNPFSSSFLHFRDWDPPKTIQLQKSETYPWHPPYSPTYIQTIIQAVCSASEVSLKFHPFLSLYCDHSEANIFIWTLQLVYFIDLKLAYNLRTRLLILHFGQLPIHFPHWSQRDLCVTHTRP